MPDRDDTQRLPPIARANAMHEPLRSNWRSRLIALLLVLIAAALALYFLMDSGPAGPVAGNAAGVTYITVQPAPDSTSPARE